MKKLLSMLLVIALIMGSLGTFALAADETNSKVKIRIENGMLYVQIGDEILKAPCDPKNPAMGLAKNAKGQLIISFVTPSGKVKSSNLGVETTNITLYGDMSKVSLASSLSNTNVGLAKGCNVGTLNNRSSEVEVGKGATAGKLNSISSLPIVINGEVTQARIKAPDAKITVNGKIDIARTEGGASMDVNGSVGEAQAKSGGSINVNKGGGVNTVKSVGGNVSVAEGGSAKNVAVKDSKVDVKGSADNLQALGKTDISVGSSGEVKNTTATGETNLNVSGKAGNIKATGSASVNVNKGAVTDNIALDKDAKAAVAGNVTGTVSAEGKASVEAQEGSKIAELSAKGESSIKTDTGSYVGELSADEKSKLTTEKGSEALSVKVSGESSAELGGTTNKVVVAGDSDLKLVDGSKTGTIDNKDANKDFELGKGAIAGTVTDEKKMENNGGELDPSIKEDLVADKPIESKPSVVPSTAPTSAPSVAPTASAAPTAAPSASATVVPTAAPTVPTLPPVVPTAPPLPTSTPAPTATAVPTSTATPTPTKTPSPTTPVIPPPVQITVQGVTAIDGITAANNAINKKVAINSGNGTYTPPTTVTIKKSDNTTASVNVTWSPATFDTTTAGTKVFTGTITPPSGVTNPNGVNATINLTVAQGYTITYNGNGHTSGTVPVDNTKYLAGDTITLDSNTGSLAKTGMTFKGWATTSNATTALTTYTIESANVTLYAVWADETAPTLSEGTSMRTDAASGRFEFKSDEAGTYYFLLLESTATAPNAAAIKAQGTAIDKGTAAASNGYTNPQLANMETAKAYIIYIVVEDTASNISDILSVNVTSDTAQKSHVSLPASVSINNITAEVSIKPANPVSEGSTVIATVSLVGSADNFGTHTIDLTSTKAGLATSVKTVAVTAGQTNFASNNQIFSFTMPSEDVDDLVLTNTFAPLTGITVENIKSVTTTTKAPDIAVGVKNSDASAMVVSQNNFFTGVLAASGGTVAGYISGETVTYKLTLTAKNGYMFSGDYSTIPVSTYVTGASGNFKVEGTPGITLVLTYSKTLPIALSGTASIAINANTGELTASVTGGNTATAGQLTYLWSGTGVSTNNTSASFDATGFKGVALTCTISANTLPYSGTLTATETIYQVTVTPSGNTGTDSATITNSYGKVGNDITINYTLDSTGKEGNSLTYSVGAGTLATPTTNPITTPATSTSIYKISASNASSGVIALTATFAHKNRSLAYSPAGFEEADTNDGSISQVMQITLTNDTFTGTNSQPMSNVSAKNVPTGLTAVFTKTSDTVVTLSFTGKASSHITADNISDLTVTFANGAFTKGNAAIVTDATKSNLTVTFKNSPGNVPTVSVTTGSSLSDATQNLGSFNCDFSVTQPSDISNVNGYKLYWGKSSTEISTVNSRIISTTPKTTAGTSIKLKKFENSDTIPSDASHLLIYTYNDSGMQQTPFAFNLAGKDLNLIPNAPGYKIVTSTPQAENEIQLDTNIIVGGNPAPANNKTYLSANSGVTAAATNFQAVAKFLPGGANSLTPGSTFSIDNGTVVHTISIAAPTSATTVNLGTDFTNQSGIVIVAGGATSGEKLTLSGSIPLGVTVSGGHADISGVTTQGKTTIGGGTVNLAPAMTSFTLTGVTHGADTIDSSNAVAGANPLANIGAQDIATIQLGTDGAVTVGATAGASGTHTAYFGTGSDFSSKAPTFKVDVTVNNSAITSITVTSLPQTP